MKKTVLVKGPALSLSGYGEQARFALRSLKDREDVDLYFIDIPWGRTGKYGSNKEERQWILSLLEKTRKFVEAKGGKPDFDISVQVTIPNEFEKLAKFNIGYTAGIETTKVSPEWLKKSNEMDKIIVPSKHSKSVFEETKVKATMQTTGETVDYGVRVPVEACAFPAKEQKFDTLDLPLKTDWNFLSVAQWGPRKNVEATIKNFLLEFKEDEVGLVLKINMSKNSIMDKMAVENRVEALVEKHKKEHGDFKCKLYVLHGNLTDEEMRGLYHHPKIKAFVTTTHGEGFGLPMFDAAISQLPVIAPAWSSYVDFLYAPKKIKGGKEKMKPHFTKIDFNLSKVQKEAVWNGVIQEDSQWCFVKDNSVRSAMREVRKNYGPKLSDAKKLSKFVLENFEEQKQTELLSSLIYKKKVLNPKQIDGISFCIPTNGRRKEKTDATIKSIKKQNWGDVKYEIIICGDVSAFEDSEEVRLIDKADEAHSKKVSLLRNTAAEESMFENIAFCDDDIVLENHWLENTMRFSETNGWEILGNKILNPDGTRHWDKALLLPRMLVDYDHSDYDSRLMQTSGFFLMRKSSFIDNKWDETKLVYADREQGGIPEDVQFNLDFKKKDMVFRFNDSSTVWHNDDTYTEFGQQTLKKELIEEKTGMANFLSESEDFLKCLNSL